MALVSKIVGISLPSGGGGTPVTISPSQLTASVNDWNPTGLSGATIVRVSSDASMREITGLDTGADGRTVRFQIIGSYPVIFVAKSDNSTAANRFNIPRSVVAYPGTEISFGYDNTDTNWMIASSSQWPNSGRSTYWEFLPGSTTAADHGIWSFFVTGGSLSTQAPSSTVPAAGWYLLTGTTTTGLAAMFWPKTINAFGIFKKGFLSSFSVIRVPGLSTSGDRMTIVYRMANSAASASFTTSGHIGFRYSDNVNSGKWQAYSYQSTGFETYLDTGVTVAVGIYTLGIEMNYLGTEARYYINGNYVGKITTNLPLEVSFGGQINVVKSTGTTQLGVIAFSVKCEYHF